MSLMSAVPPLPAGGGDDLTALRRAGVLEGYGPTEHVHQRARRRAWRRLAGLDGDAVAGPTAAAAAGNSVPHQIRLDVARAFAYPACSAWDAEQRAAKLAQLAGVLADVFPEDDASSRPPPAPVLRYYQGLHDVASLLLVAAGPVHAPALLTHALRRGGLLPYARGDGAGVPLALDALALMMALLARADAPLHAHVLASGVAPHWGLSWLLTLFAHDVGDVGAGVRLLDCFLGGGHPALPVYAAVALLRSRRAGVLALDPEDTGPFHAHLKRLPAALVTAADAGQLLTDAAALYRAVPPRALLSRRAWDAGSGADGAGYARLQREWPELWAGGPLRLDAGGVDPLLDDVAPGAALRWLPLAKTAAGWYDALAGGGLWPRAAPAPGWWSWLLPPPQVRSAVVAASLAAVLVAAAVAAWRARGTGGGAGGGGGGGGTARVTAG